MTSVTAVRDLVAVGACSTARARRRPASPAELGRVLFPGFRITPAVAMVSDALLDAITQPDRRLIVTMPPREGKSTLVSVIGTLFALSRNPDQRVILASYADSLAEEHSRTARALIAEHSEVLGFTLSSDQTSVARWRVDGRDGGLRAVGILSGVTGFGADCLMVDDATKNAQEADSPSQRRKILAEFRSTLLTRVHPGGSVVLIGTRWNEEDLIGSLLADEPDRWTYLNIPAVAEDGIPDALGREPGTAMSSALGRTPEQFEDIRRSVGSRSWYALFQGMPSSPEGGRIKREWLEQYRIPAAPAHPLKTIVAVDPADSGLRDEAGVIAASLGSDGRVSIIADVSGQMTSEEWSTAAVQLALDVDASAIHVEAYSTGTTYVRVVNEVLARRRVSRSIPVKPWRQPGSAASRAAPLLQAFEVGACRLAGHFPEFIDQATGWHVDQKHCPDRVSAAVIAHDVLAIPAGQRWTFTPPNLTAKITDRPGLDANGLPGQRQPSAASINRLSRNVHGTGYDALAYPTRVIR